MERSVAFAIAVVVGLVSGATLIALYSNVPAGTTSTTRQVSVTIVMSHQGFNGSAFTTPPWPVLSVHQGETVTIRLENEDPVEAHGFAISHYLDGGVTVRPGETYSFSFVADQQGTFTVYCNIFCTVHVYMQKGQLIVA